jgi:hypothetical protein
MSSKDAIAKAQWLLVAKETTAPTTQETPTSTPTPTPVKEEVIVKQGETPVNTDTEIKQEFELKKATRNINIIGRGGTDFQCAIDYYEQHPEYQGLIIFTDGYACVPKIRLRKQILWILTGKQEYDEAYRWIKELKLNKATWIPSVKKE